MTLRHREPMHELERMRREMERVWSGDIFPWGMRFPRLLERFPVEPDVAVDMYEEGNNLIVKADVPGFRAEDVKVDITGNVLTLKGETKVEKEEKKADYYYHERRYGSFSRSLTLPSGLNTDKVEATFEDGVVTVAVPKTEAAKTKVIKVTAKEKKA